jgi:hypothetical protein
MRDNGCAAEFLKIAISGYFATNKPWLNDELVQKSIRQ